MSGTDDTDDLIVVLPDTFHTDSEYSQQLGTFYGIVDELISVVDNLDQRIKSLEKAPNESNEYEMSSLKMPSRRKYGSSDDIKFPTEDNRCNSTQSTPQKRKTKFTLDSSNLEVFKDIEETQKSTRSFDVSSRASEKREQLKNDYELLVHARANFLSRIDGFMDYFRKKMFFNLPKSGECTPKSSGVDDKSTINDNKQRVKQIQDVVKMISVTDEFEPIALKSHVRNFIDDKKHVTDSTPSVINDTKSVGNDKNIDTGEAGDIINDMKRIKINVNDTKTVEQGTQSGDIINDSAAKPKKKLKSTGHQLNCIKNKEKAMKNIDTQTLYDQRVCDIDDELELRLNLSNFSSDLRDLETEFGLEFEPNDDEDVNSKTDVNDDPEEMAVCDVGDDIEYTTGNQCGDVPSFTTLGDSLNGVWESVTSSCTEITQSTAIFNPNFSDDECNVMKNTWDYQRSVEDQRKPAQKHSKVRKELFKPLRRRFKNSEHDLQVIERNKNKQKFRYLPKFRNDRNVSEVTKEEMYLNKIDEERRSRQVSIIRVINSSVLIFTVIQLSAFEKKHFFRDLLFSLIWKGTYSSSSSFINSYLLTLSEFNYIIFLYVGCVIVLIKSKYTYRLVCANSHPHSLH